MNPLSNTFVTGAIVALSLATPAFAQKGNGHGGGNFPDSPALLTAAEHILGDAIRGADPSAFDNMPALWSTWTQDTMAAAIEHTERHLTEEGPVGIDDEGDSANRLYDYDVDARRLIVYKDFFLRYESQTEWPLSERAVDRIQIDLLHEFAHLLGIGRLTGKDHLALEFAIRLLGRIRSCPLRITHFTPAPGQAALQFAYENTPLVSDIPTIRNYLGGTLARRFPMHCSGVQEFPPFSAIHLWDIRVGETCDGQTYRSWEQDERLPAPLALVLPFWEHEERRYGEPSIECRAFKPEGGGLAPIEHLHPRHEEGIVTAGRLVDSLRVTPDGKIYGRMGEEGSTFQPVAEPWCPAVEQPKPIYFECKFNTDDFNPATDNIGYQKIGRVCFVDEEEKHAEEEKHGTKKAFRTYVTDFDRTDFYYENPYFTDLLSRNELWKAAELPLTNRLGFRLNDEKNAEKAEAQALEYVAEGKCDSAYVVEKHTITTLPIYPGDVPHETIHVEGHKISQ